MVVEKCKTCKSELLVYPQIKLCPLCQKGEHARLAKEYYEAKLKSVKVNI